MNARERFNAVMAFEKPDRLPVMEFMHYWPETLERWQGEGMPADVNPDEYFGYDPFEWLGVDFNFVPAFEVEVLEEDEKTRKVRDVTGVVKQEFKHGSAMPHYIDFPIKTRSDFLNLKEQLDPTSPERYPGNWADIVERMRGRDFPVGVVCRGFLAFMRDFMDFQDMSMTFLTDPEWVREMMDFHCDFMIRLYDTALSEVEIDMFQFGEDMAFKNGPMVSPDLVREMMVPNYKKMVSFLRDHGVKNIIVDSDGDIRSLIPHYLDAGITGVLPLENNAFCSPVTIREMFPRLQMIGGVDKQTIAKDGKFLEDEVALKVGKVGATGGYVPSFDHSVHPGTSLETYKRYMDHLREWSVKAVQ